MISIVLLVGWRRRKSEKQLQKKDSSLYNLPTYQKNQKTYVHLSNMIQKKAASSLAFIAHLPSLAPTNERLQKIKYTHARNTLLPPTPF